tara:strand:- start:2403 stop:2822 length:420 start_codon:yes stop_codon:yes gene_type:complete
MNLARKYLTQHNPTSDSGPIQIHAMDDPGPEGVRHLYKIFFSGPHGMQVRTDLAFQKGAVVGAGQNGITIETLLAICLDRLRDFQDGSKACDFYEIALHHTEAALQALHEKTRKGEVEEEPSQREVEFNDFAKHQDHMS